MNFHKSYFKNSTISIANSIYHHNSIQQILCRAFLQTVRFPLDALYHTDKPTLVRAQGTPSSISFIVEIILIALYCDDLIYGKTVV